MDKPLTTDSNWGLVAVLLAVGAVGTAIVLLWLLTVPRPASALEAYYPLAPGVTQNYRVTQPDGRVQYRTRNVERLRGSEGAAQMDPVAFASLLEIAGIDIENTASAAALRQLQGMTLARLTDVEVDAVAVVTRTVELVLVEPTELVLVSAPGLAFQPPLPILSQQPRNVKGEINRSQGYTASLASETHKPLDSPIGRLEDCMRVRRLLVAGGVAEETTSWFCEGVGLAREETRQGAGQAPRVTELIGLSAPERAVNAVGLPPVLGSTEAAATRVFPEGKEGALGQVWSFREQHASAGITTEPLAVGNLLLYGTQNGGMVALDRREHKLRWRFQTGGAIFSAPVAAQGMVFFGSSDRRLYALDLVSGGLRWVWRAQDAITGRPTVSGGVVYAGAEDRTLYALDAATGRERWRFAAGGPLASAPVVAAGSVYVGSDDGALYALNAASGRVKWAFAAGDGIAGAPVVAEGRVYFGSFDEKLYALKAETSGPQGELIWSTAVRTALTGELVLREGRLYAALGNDLRAFEAADGNEVWHYHSPSPLLGAPLLWGNRLLVGRAHDVVALDVGRGVAVGAYPTAETSGSVGLASDGSEIYAGQFDGTLIALAPGE